MACARYKHARRLDTSPRGYGATAARVTPDHKVGSSNFSGLSVATLTRVVRAPGDVCGVCVRDTSTPTTASQPPAPWHAGLEAIQPA